MTSSSIIGSKEQNLQRDGHIKGLLTTHFALPVFLNILKTKCSSTQIFMLIGDEFGELKNQVKVTW
jgi:hypothetical protein